MSFSLVYSNSFPTVGAGTSVLGAEWELYNGDGNAGWGKRRPSAISVVADATAVDGPNVLQQQATMGTGGDTGFMVSGGMKLLVPITYGRVVTRVKIADDPDQCTSGVVILWPTVDPVRWPTEADVWPAGIELDIWETWGDRFSRTPAETNINRLRDGVTHGPPFTEADRQLYHREWAGVDASAWHELEFTWLPHRMTLAIDGGQAIEIADPSWIPHWDHELTFQLDGFDSPNDPGNQPVLRTGNTPTLKVDYVRLYSWSPDHDDGTTRRVTLVAKGRRRTLACSADPYQLKGSARLWGLAPYAVTSRAVGEIPGERVESVRALARTVVVPVQVEGDAELAVDLALGELGDLSPTEDVQIIYTRPDGTTRELTARYAGGGEAVSATDESGHLQRHVTVPLIFKAHFPYWADSAGVQQHGPAALGDGLLATSMTATVVNTGDVECWPELIITGFSDSFEAVNLTTGQGFRIRRIIPAGSTVRVDTDKRSFRLMVDDVDDYGAADPTSAWWPLVPGENALWWRGNSDAPGLEPMGSFTVRWRPIHETP